MKKFYFPILAAFVVLAAAYFYYNTLSFSPSCKNECNVIFIISDALGAKHMGLYASKRNTTPFIDSYFGEGGIVYKNAWSTASWTLPSFASFLRSKYPSDIKIGDLVENENALPALLRKEDVTIAAFLKKSRNLAILQSIQIPFLEHEYAVFDYNDHEEPFREASLWLKNWEKNMPENPKQFFLMLHDTTAHDEFDPPSPYRNLFDGTDASYLGPIASTSLRGDAPKKLTEEEKIQIERQYDQEIRYFDDLFKNFVESVPKAVLDNTVVVLIADHGEAFGEHEGRFYHANSLYEELLHVPLLIHAPGIKPATITEPVSLLDISPTILNFFGIKTNNKNFEGKILPSKVSRNPAPRIIRAEQGIYPLNIRFDLKATTPEERQKSMYESLKPVALRNGKWKIIFPGVVTSYEIYNLEEDLGEQTNLSNSLDGLSKKDRDIIEKLIKEADEVLKRTR